MLTIEHQRCQRDDLCLAVCPMGLIVKDEDGNPRLRDGGEELCIACGHCTAVCPTAALTNRLLPAAETPQLSAQPVVSATALTQLLHSRRSIRNFRDQPIPRERISALLEATR